MSCDYLFGNLSDMKRHLRVRHHVQVEDMGPLEELTDSNPPALVDQVTADQQQPLQVGQYAICYVKCENNM